MSINNTESPSPFPSQVLPESRLSSYYCSQSISVQNIDHLLGN